VALDKAKKSLCQERLNNVNWIVDDITEPTNINNIDYIDLWHDRTVLHFLTEEAKCSGYLNSLRKWVKVNGYVIIAVFTLNGTKKSSGQQVKNYDQKMISDFWEATLNFWTISPFLISNHLEMKGHLFIRCFREKINVKILLLCINISPNR